MNWGQVWRAHDAHSSRSLVISFSAPIFRLYGLDIMSAFPETGSTGREMCSCTISHLPLLF
jgi:hypothetical protein